MLNPNNIFHTTPVPYDTTDTDGDKVTIHCVLDDGRLLGIVHGSFAQYGELFTAEGVNSHHDRVRLKEPKPYGYEAYLEAPQHFRESIELTFAARKKITGIKWMRAQLGIGLSEAKRLYEFLAIQPSEFRFEPTYVG